MRISVWSSDVCSSVLFTLVDELPSLLRDAAGAVPAQAMLFEAFLAREAKAGRLDALKLRPIADKALLHGQKGRASVRERGGQYVLIPVVAVTLKKKIHIQYINMKYYKDS